MTGSTIVNYLLGYNAVQSVSEEHVISIFRVEEYAKQEASMKQVAAHILSTNYQIGTRT
jgi:hypothetical protein